MKIERAALSQNLTDAGCDKNLSGVIIKFLEEERTDDALFLLSKHRKNVLDNCRAEQKKLDCLDYLTYRLKQEK